MKEMEQPWPDELADDLQSMSFNSTTTATTADFVNRSPSSSSETTTLTASSSLSSKFRSQLSDSDPLFSAILRSRSASPSGSITFTDIRFLRRLGSGDIGAVYLAKLKSSTADGELFAAKLMDKAELASRKKEGRARTEMEVLECLDHPFLPKLYAAIDSPKLLCILTEFSPGGDLHVLRQRQPLKRFDESSVRFYAAEIVAALEYLHMMGIVYRDLKPENVLVRSDGHIMLTDFDLSLKCDHSSTPAQLITKPNQPDRIRLGSYPAEPAFASSCILPKCIVPAVSCFRPRIKRKKKPGSRSGPKFVAEPVDVRSISFVGTYEYLAPEIISGEGHGSAVDWWTLGVFIFELLYGTTPFKGADNELTLANVIARALEFPKEPPVAIPAKDLVSQLLAKDPAKRLGSTMGAAAIKQHPFFQGVNWALLRCQPPPFVPPVEAPSEESGLDPPVEFY